MRAELAKYKAGERAERQGGLTKAPLNSPRPNVKERAMKAAYFMKNGGPEVMQYGDVPDPVAGPARCSSTSMRRA